MSIPQTEPTTVQQAPEDVKTHFESEIQISRTEMGKNRKKRGRALMEVRKEMEE